MYGEKGVCGCQTHVSTFPMEMVKCPHEPTILLDGGSAARWDS